MLSPTLIRIGITAALGLHSIAHADALKGLARQALGEVPALPAQMWPLAGVDPAMAAMVGLPLWFVATAAFAQAAVSFWGVVLPWLDVELTTVVQPLADKGRATARAVLARIAGEDVDDVVLPVHLRVGGSTGPA